jgi:hypothetical protein
MKKIIMFSSIAMAGLILNVACEKEQDLNQEISQNFKSSEDEKLNIDLQEFQIILDEVQSTEINGIQEKAPKWWNKFTDWVKSHSGSSQKWVNGQPSCFGDGGCGPCAGACFRSIETGGDNGHITQEEFVQGFRAIAFSIIEKNENGIQRKMIIEIPYQFESDFIMDNKMRVSDDEFLPEFFVKKAGFKSVKVESGLYPVVQNPQMGRSFSIVNIVVE